jgi:hypothetical protein
LKYIKQINLCEFNSTSLTLEEIGLNQTGKNIFEIHEKEGPPKRLKAENEQSDENEDVTQLSSSNNNYASLNTVQDYFNDNDQHSGSSRRSPSRRNACVDGGGGGDSSYVNCATSPVGSSSNFNYGPSNINQPTGSGYFSASSGYTSNYGRPDIVITDDESGYVGLINQAMTCYLNSLLQTLYMTPEFRNAIYR